MEKILIKVFINRKEKMQADFFRVHNFGRGAGKPGRICVVIGGVN